MKSTKQKLGITGKFKPNSIPENHKDIGFWPIGRYNDDEEFTFGDANYWLYRTLGHEIYNKLETHIINVINAKTKNIQACKGTFGYNINAHIDWKVTTEKEYNSNH